MGTCLTIDMHESRFRTKTVKISSRYLADHPNFDALGIHNVCIFTSGVMLALVPSCQTFTMLLIDGVFYGFFIGTYLTIHIYIHESLFRTKKIEISSSSIYFADVNDTY